MRRVLVSSLVVGIAGALLLAPAASAAPVVALPEGDQIVLIDCDDAPGQAFTMGADGAATPIGPATMLDNNSNCSPSGAINPVDGKTYYIAWGGGSSTHYLATLDRTTGASTAVAPLSGDTSDSCGIAIDAAGNAFNASGTSLYSLNLVTGVNTLVGNTTHNQTCSWGINPVDNEIYWFTRTGPTNSDVYRISKTDGAATFVVSLDVSALSGYSPDGVVFDKNGIAWIQDDECDGPDNWCGVEPADLTAGVVYSPTGYFHDATQTVYAANFEGVAYFYSMGMIYVPAPAPALAATGSASSAISGGMVAAGVLLLGGVVFLTMRRRSATR